MRRAPARLWRPNRVGYHRHPTGWPPGIAAAAGGARVNDALDTREARPGTDDRDVPVAPLLEPSVGRASPSHPVTLMLSAVEGLAERRAAAGEAAAEATLQRVAAVLADATQRFAGAAVGRAGPGTLAVVLPGEGGTTAELVARTSAAAIGTAPDLRATAGWGIATARSPVSPGELEARARLALDTAEQIGGGRICFDRADRPASMAPPAPRGRDRSRREEPAAVADAIAILERLHDGGSAAERLEAAAAAFAQELDAAGWSISQVDPGEVLFHVIGGRDSRIDAGTGRVVAVAVSDPYRIEDYPRTSRALAEGSGFHVRVDDPNADLAERAYLRDLGFSETIAAAVADDEGSYLVEIYGDEHTPPLDAAATALQVLATLAVTARDPAALVRGGLKAAKAGFDAAFGASPMAMALVEPSGRFLHVNPALCRLMRRQPAELLASDFQAVSHPDDLRDEVANVMATLAGERDGYVVDKRVVLPDGTDVWVTQHATLVRDAAGEPAYFLGHAEDISDRKRAEARARERADHLKRLAVTPPAEREAGDPEAGTEEVIRRALDVCRRQLRVPVAYLTRIDGTRLTVRSIDTGGAPSGTEAGSSMPLDATICSRLLAGRVGELICDTAVPPPLAEIPEVTALIGAYVGVPVVLADGTVYGTLCCIDRVARPDLTDGDARLLRDLAGVIAAQLDHDRRRVQEGQLRSGLTGIRALVAALEARDLYTGRHSRTVVQLARAVAEQLGLAPSAAQEAGHVALLHDIGKVAIPDAVLQKPGRLTEAEWEVMRQHPGIGARIVGSISDLAHLAAAVRSEHERWDGTGYPDGLSGEAIPLASRITLACDAYDAMTSERPYRSARTPGQARAELRQHAGTQFDPAVVAALEAVLDAWPDTASAGGAGAAPVAPAA